MFAASYCQWLAGSHLTTCRATSVATVVIIDLFDEEEKKCSLLESARLLERIQN